MASKRRMSVSGGLSTGRGGPNSDINVTPLVDVVLVLLIIFMVVTPLLEKDIEVKVPDTEEMPEDMPEPPADQLVVGVSADGQIAINLEKVTDDEYLVRLKRMIAAKKTGDRLVFFMPDDKVNYGKLISVLDGARAAGAETLGMMTEIPPGGLQQAAPADPNAPPPPPTP